MKPTNLEYAKSLRAIADFYEANPELPLPDCVSNIEFKVFYATKGVETLRHFVRAFGDCEKYFDDGRVGVKKRFGVIDLCAEDVRDAVCTKKVVGTRHVEERILPEVVFPAHDVEVVEWECSDSFLQDGDTKK